MADASPWGETVRGSPQQRPRSFYLLPGDHIPAFPLQALAAQAVDLVPHRLRVPCRRLDWDVELANKPGGRELDMYIAIKLLLYGPLDQPGAKPTGGTVLDERRPTALLPFHV